MCEHDECGGCTCFKCAPCNHCTEHLDEDGEELSASPPSDYRAAVAIFGADFAKTRQDFWAKLKTALDEGSVKFPSGRELLDDSYAFVDVSGRMSASEVKTRMKAGTRERFGNSGWSIGSPAPDSPGSHCMKARMESIGEVCGVPGAARTHNRDGHLTANDTHRLKVQAAKAAIARYAREKKLPSPEMCALFGELDTVQANRRLRAAGADHIPGLVDVDRHNDRLTSEALGRCFDQAWESEGTGAYGHLVRAAGQRLPDML